jgi:hypothetical protein
VSNKQIRIAIYAKVFFDSFYLSVRVDNSDTWLFSRMSSICALLIKKPSSVRTVYTCLVIRFFNQGFCKNSDTYLRYSLCHYMSLPTHLSNLDDTTPTRYVSIMNKYVIIGINFNISYLREICAQNIGMCLTQQNLLQCGIMLRSVLIPRVLAVYLGMYIHIVCSCICVKYVTHVMVNVHG